MLTWTWRSSSSPDGRMVTVPPRSCTGAPSRLQDTRGSGMPRAAQGSSASCPSSTASSTGLATMVGGTGWDRLYHIHTNNPAGSRDAAKLPSELSAASAGAAVGVPTPRLQHPNPPACPQLQPYLARSAWSSPWQCPRGCEPRTGSCRRLPQRLGGGAAARWGAPSAQALWGQAGMKERRRESSRTRAQVEHRDHSACRLPLSEKAPGNGSSGHRTHWGAPGLAGHPAPVGLLKYTIHRSHPAVLAALPPKSTPVQGLAGSAGSRSPRVMLAPSFCQVTSGRGTPLASQDSTALVLTSTSTMPGRGFKAGGSASDREMFPPASPQQRAGSRIP